MFVSGIFKSNMIINSVELDKRRDILRRLIRKALLSEVRR